jgi:tape measure domain-containing protein
MNRDLELALKLKVTKDGDGNFRVVAAGVESVATAADSAAQSHVRQAHAASQAAISERALAGQQQRSTTQTNETIQRERELEQARLRTIRSNHVAAQALAKHRRALEQDAAAADTVITRNNGLIASYGRLAAAIAGGFAVTKVSQAVRDVLQVGAQFELLGKQLESLYGSSAKGEQAMAWIRQFTTNTAYELDQVTQGFIKLKAFGLDPMDGTYQAIADQAATLGGSQEALQGIVLALGQAWSKQKLQGEEALQLIERGVPVWDLLAQATGRNTVELQQMSAAGKLGRDTIRALIDEMGRANSGAATGAMDTLAGQFSNLKDNWAAFLNLVADSGALDYFRDEIKTINEAIKEMAETGELQEWAQKAADAIVWIADHIKDSAVFITQHADAIAALLKVAAAFKAINFASEFLGIGKGAAGAEKRVVMLEGAIANLRAAGLLAAAGIGYAFGTQLREELKDTFTWLETESERITRQAAHAGAEQAAHIARVAKDGADALADYATQRIATQRTIDKMDAEELAAYRAKLSEAQRYWSYIKIQQETLGNRTGVAEAQQALDDYGAALASVEEAMRLVATAADSRITPAAQRMVEQFRQLVDSGKSVSDALRDIGQVRLEDGTAGLRNQIQALQQLRDDGVISSKQLADAWRQTLAQISDRDLPAFIAQIHAVGDASESAAAAIEAGLGAALKHLGIDAERAFNGISAPVRNALAHVDTLAEHIDDLRAKGADVGEVFAQSLQKSLATAQTEKELQSVIDKFAALAKLSPEMGAALAAPLEEASKKLAEITSGVQTVAEAYQQLGLTAPDALKKAAAAAREAYEVIRNSGATIAEQQRAWLAYAQAAIAANDGVADAALRAEAAVLGVAEQLDKIDGSAQRAAEAMAKVAAAHTQHINEAERATTALEREGAANVAAARAALEHAKAQGDLTEARRLEIAVADAQVESAANIAKAKMAEVAAAERLVAALQAEAEADGVVLDTERQAIEQAQQVVDAKREAAAAAQQAADAAKREADALRQAAATMREVSVDLVQWAQSVGVAAEQVDAFLDIVDRLRQAYYADGGSAEFAHEAETQWTNVAKAAAAAWQKFVDAKSAGESAANGIANATGNAADETRKLEAAARNAMQYSSALGAERLAQLRAALDDAQRKMQDLKDEAADTLAQLNDELAQMQGRYVDAQKARNAQRRAELQAQLEEARAAGNTDAVAQLVKAMRVLDQIAAAQLEEAKAREAEARERAKEQPAPDAAPTPEPQTQAPVPPPSRSTQPVPPPAPQGRSTNWQIHVSVSGNLDPERLARELKPHLERIMRLTE